MDIGKDKETTQKCGLTRRGFVQHLGFGGAVAGLATVLPTAEARDAASPTSTLVLKVNGRQYKLKIGSGAGQVQSSDTLAFVLRETLDLTGTKTPCDRGECGGCTVLMDGEAVLSCCTLAVECQGKEIQTIESLGDSVSGKLDPIQQAIVDQDAIQCGMCTPGMVMSMKSLFNQNPKPTRPQIREAISGNLCRCTGYVKYIEAAEIVAKRG